MSNYPRITLAGSNQFPAIATSIPSQLPVYEIVDGAGVVVTNIGNGPADGTWTNMTLMNGFTAGAETPQYMKDSRGKVHLRGLAICPGSQVTMWAVPVGFRPAIDASSENLYDWSSGGTDLQNPGRTARVNATHLNVGYTSAGNAGAADAIMALDRIVWVAA